MPDEPTPGEPIEQPIREYIANGAAEGALSAAQRLSEAIGVGLDEILAAVQGVGSREPAAALAGEGSMTVGGPTAGVVVTAPAGTVFVSDADVGSATESLSVVRQADVDKLAQASRRGLAAVLSANQRILLAIILIAAVYPVLPPELQKALMDEAMLTAALAAVLTLLKR